MLKRLEWKGCEEKNIESFLDIFCKKYVNLFRHHKDNEYFFKGNLRIFHQTVLPVLEKHKEFISHKIIGKYNNTANENGLIIELKIGHTQGRNETKDAAIT